MSGQWKTTYPVEEKEWVDCPFCSSPSCSELGLEWSLRIVQCSFCGLVYVSPRLKNPERNYWGERERILQKYGAIFDGLQPHSRDRNYREHLQILGGISPAGRILDVGTHCGFFLSMARKRGREVYGIEPSPTNAALAREVFQLNVRTGYLKDGVFPLEYFDIVTAIDVFEHVTIPLDLLRTIREILKPGGILFVKVPNVRWNMLKHRVLVKFLKRADFDIFDSREHVIQYSQETLVKMLERAGFVMERMYVPRPIQTGEWWKKVARFGAFLIARISFRATGTPSPFATDLACVAKKG